MRKILLNHVAKVGTERITDIDLSTFAMISDTINTYIDLELRFAIAVFSDLAAGHIRN